MTDRQVGLIAVIFSISGYALLPVLIRTFYQQSTLQATDLAIWRFIFATPAIWLVIWLRKNFGNAKPEKRDSKLQIARMMSLGLLYTCASLSVVFGLRYITASLYTVLFYTYPAMVALISLFLGQKLRIRAWIAIGLTMLGVMFTVPDLSLAGENTALGLSIAIFNAVVVAIYFVIISREMPKVSSVSRGAAYVITGTLVILLMLIPFFGFRMPENLTVWGLIIIIATWSTAMPIFIINIAIQKLGVTQASIISTSEPIATMILAMIFLNESILPVQWLGAGLIIAGVIMLELRSNKKLIKA